MRSVSQSLAALSLLASGLVSAQTTSPIDPSVTLIVWQDYNFKGNSSAFSVKTPAGARTPCVNIYEQLTDVSSIDVAPIEAPDVSTTFYVTTTCIGPGLTIDGAGKISLDGNDFDNHVASFRVTALAS